MKAINQKHGLDIGDLVRLSEADPAIAQDWGFGLISEVTCSDGIDRHERVEVIWPKKAFVSTAILKSRVEVINESH